MPSQRSLEEELYPLHAAEEATDDAPQHAVAGGPRMLECANPLGRIALGKLIPSLGFYETQYSTPPGEGLHPAP